MQGLQRIVVLAMAMAWTAPVCSGAPPGFDPNTVSSAQQQQAAVIAQRTIEHIVFSQAGRSPIFREVQAPGASFIKLHFSHFKIPQGITLEISNPEGNELWRYSAGHRDAFTVDESLGDDGERSFSAMSITGDTAIIRLTGDIRRLDPDNHLVVIDSYLEGLPLASKQPSFTSQSKIKENPGSSTESACGDDQRYGSVCWASSHPWEEARSGAVAKLITSNGVVCTAWRVGPDNHLFTAQHCLTKQSHLDGAEIWFNYAATACGSSETTTPVKVTGGTLLSTNIDLDYTLFTVSDFSSISQFPAFGLDVRNGPEGEAIWIPQHGNGQPRQIALESDMNSSGVCEIDEANRDGYAPGSDIGYFCDTVNSSSGAPVVAYDSGRVLAIHHFGGCLNAGVKISKIWPEVSSFFDGEIPNGNTGGGSPGPGNQLPQAVIDVSCDELQCSFDASGSSDPDGEIASYSWELSDGGSSKVSSFVHEFQDEGSYDVTLTVEDDEGASSDDSESLSLSLPNQEPVAVISTSCINNACQFNANGSHDTDGSIVAWDWSLGDGEQASGKSIEHEYASEGSYTVTLTVEDNDQATGNSSRTVNLMMPNDSPEANFSFSCSELDCNFDAAASSDPDGTIASWNWIFGDGGSASGEQVNHRYADEGSYSVSLSVEDDDGATDSYNLNVTIALNKANESPEADFSFYCTELECSFDAGASSDPDGNIVAWNWTFGDGVSASGRTVSHEFTSAGSFTVELVVADNEGATDIRSHTVKPEGSNSIPTASFSYECDELKCRFDAAKSGDSDGEIVDYTWSLSDGRQSSDEVFEHEFPAQGSWTVTLTVTDDQGDSDSRTRTVNLQESSPEIMLDGEGGLFNGRSLATLRWSGALTTMVEIYRDGDLLAVTENDGKHVDTSHQTYVKVANYRLCQPSPRHCSELLKLKFTP